MAERSAGLMSREQQTTADFGQSISQLRSHLEVPEARTALDAMAEAIMRFAACEFRMRRVDRVQALGLKDDTKMLVEAALADNERGLAALSGVEPLVKFLREQKTEAEMLSDWKDASAQIRAEWRGQISDADVSGHHAEIIARMMDDCCDAVDEGGFAGVGEYLDRTVRELRNARTSEDRGTRIASFPYWKIVACAAVVGVSVIWVIAAIIGKWPWWAWFMIALAGCILMTLAVMGCQG